MTSVRIQKCILWLRLSKSQPASLLQITQVLAADHGIVLYCTPAASSNKKVCLVRTCMTQQPRARTRTDKQLTTSARLPICLSVCLIRCPFAHLRRCRRAFRRLVCTPVTAHTHTHYLCAAAHPSSPACNKQASTTGPRPGGTGTLFEPPLSRSSREGELAANEQQDIYEELVLDTASSLPLCSTQATTAIAGVLCW